MEASPAAPPLDANTASCWPTACAAFRPSAASARARSANTTMTQVNDQLTSWRQPGFLLSTIHLCPQAFPGSMCRAAASQLSQIYNPPSKDSFASPRSSLRWGWSCTTSANGPMPGPRATASPRPSSGPASPTTKLTTRGAARQPPTGPRPVCRLQPRRGKPSPVPVAKPAAHRQSRRKACKRLRRINAGARCPKCAHRPAARRENRPARPDALEAGVRNNANNTNHTRCRQAHGGDAVVQIRASRASAESSTTAAGSSSARLSAHTNPFAGNRSDGREVPQRGF